MRRLSLAVFLLLLAGCGPDPNFQPDPAPTAMFSPTAMRIHPIFTQVKDWNGDNKPDGIEVLIEFQDQFDDPTKASGRVIFELFEYRKDSPDPRGKRLTNPWIGSLVTLGDQRERWNRTSRTYSFQLTYDQIRPDQEYVLSAIFELSGGGRFFDRIVIQPTQTELKSQPSKIEHSVLSPHKAEPPATQP